MRVGWLADSGATRGGAELTQAEFRSAAPDDIEIVDCPPGGVVSDLDKYVIHNCVLYTPEDLQVIGDRPSLKYWHDVGPHLQPGVRAWIVKHAVQVCCSPAQADYMGIAAQLIPPPVDLDRFARAAAKMNGNRKGAVSVGSWRNFGKAPHRAAEWAQAHGGIDFYGGGVFAPEGSREVSYEAMPELLAKYETFVFLPTVIEPFGRVVAEAWAAGCEIVSNRLVGATYWITDSRHDGIENAPRDFWRMVTA
jgi:glycosyltransferase involved in cell wall biosynthesis